jgi:hypothetical protein
MTTQTKNVRHCVLYPLTKILKKNKLFSPRTARYNQMIEKLKFCSSFDVYSRRSPHSCRHVKKNKFWFSDPGHLQPQMISIRTYHDLSPISYCIITRKKQAVIVGTMQFHAVSALKNAMGEYERLEMTSNTEKIANIVTWRRCCRCHRGHMKLVGSIEWLVNIQMAQDLLSVVSQMDCLVARRTQIIRRLISRHFELYVKTNKAIWVESIVY